MSQINEIVKKKTKISLTKYCQTYKIKRQTLYSRFMRGRSDYRLFAELRHNISN